MSALRKPGVEDRHAVHTGVRDGAIVKLRVCKKCGVEKVCSECSGSEFSWMPLVRGGVYWRTVCKSCRARKVREDAPGAYERPESPEFLAAHGWKYVQSGQLIAPAEPFARWLRTYGLEKRIFNERTAERAGEVDGAALAFHLGIESRRVTSVLAGEQETVSVDIIDRAILNCDLPGLEVRLPGDTVHGDDDVGSFCAIRVVFVWDVVDLFPAS